MPEASAVLFDYGRTLVTFEYPKAELRDVVERFRPRIAKATGLAAPAGEEIIERVRLLVKSGGRSGTWRRQATT